MWIQKLTLLFAASVFCSGALAQDYPQKTVKLISPIPAGGAPDLVARAVGQRLSQLWSQPVVIENKIGSNGQVAAEFVAHAAPDGYTLLVGMDSLFVINPYLYKQTNVDVNKELIPIATLGANQFVLTLNANLPVKNLTEFVAYAKKANPALAYGSAGNGSQHHLTMELLKARAEIDLLHVPYKGGTGATTATVGGETAAMFSGTSNAALIKAGKLRAIAVSGANRSKQLPDVPTISEFYPGFDNTIWIGLFAPKGTPETVVQSLRRDVGKILVMPELIESFGNAGGIEPFINTPDAMARLLKRDQVKYSKLINELKIKID
jgi:tripartite-type tricarboxylate transporter receptor subunit TctC